MFRKKQASAPQEELVEAFFENRRPVFTHFSLWLEKLLNFLGFYHFWNITLLYNTSGTPTITFQYVFSDDSNSDCSKEEEVSTEGNEDSGRYSSIQLDQLKLAHFQIHPVLIVLF